MNHFSLFVRACSVLLTCASASLAQSTTAWTLQSPNGSITIHISQHDQLTYAVSFKGHPVVTDSALSLEFKNEPPLEGKNLHFVRADQRDSDATWKPILSKNNPVRDHYRELQLEFTSDNKATPKLNVIFRAYDDGVAFRYSLPESASNELVLTREGTEFHFSVDPTLWAAVYNGFHHPYEHEYPRTKLMSLYSSNIIGLPLLVQTDANTYFAIAEADLTDWSGLYLKIGPAKSGTLLTAQLAPRLDGNGLVKLHTPHDSPWRVLMIGSKPGDLIESDIIMNLNPPSAIADTSWIHPGKMAWDHWWSGDVKMDNETEKRFIQFASDMGFPYQLVDWQWYGLFNKPEADITHPAPQLNFPELLQFAKSRNVRLWLWLHSGDVNRALQVGTLDEAFTVYEHWGIAGVKIDFMDRDDQDMVNWYETVVKLAAKRHLMVDYHGAFKPTGLRRTWPNLLTREGVLGNEYNKFSGRVTPEHKLALPFTRMLTGPMDYTPGGFLNRSPAEWKQTIPTEVMGSRAQELAILVVYESPLLCIADDPDHYRNQPGLDFLRVVPTIWDETKVLDGVVGRHIVVARRSGQDWYIGGMTADDAYTLPLSLSFLSKGSYSARVFADPTDPQASYEQLQDTQGNVTAGNTLTLKMRPAGGVAIYLKHQ
ncbi:MAG: glycoside hydrolase family 97 protein [Acidobacteriaceae bacterium]|nr:glycoside hydrolase family 97 protein [Acidobacteriaceae bacterium]